MNRLTHSRRRGFTLVEIMIVVLIIGILLAIAVPNFMRAREASRTRACIANLRQLDGAKEQWAMDNNASNGAGVTQVQLVGPANYVRTMPVCPGGGTYTINVIGTNPSCTIAGHSL